ncbi:hypothetical protein [Absidia glauca]|uniref:Peroxisomal membrane protein PEX13 n=1 Tax=Absidia glauca TaxID=4829 RepID=A0A163J9P6_ABSGL|nr:hypothetical protein [Absidia glauca]
MTDLPPNTGLADASTSNTDAKTHPLVPDRSVNVMHRPGGYVYGTMGNGGMAGRYGMGYGSHMGGMASGGMYSPYGFRGGGPSGFENGLSQRMEQGTRPAFELLHSIVGAVGSFAHMLESTFMATHSSFTVMVTMAEQLGHLKSYLGRAFSLTALYRSVKNGISGPSAISVADFQQYDTSTPPPSSSRKPLFFFVAMLVGLPYLMYKLAQRFINQQKVNRGSTVNVEFARAMYDFTPESSNELALKRGDVVAILAKIDPITQAPCLWWHGRLRDGTMGLFPANYVEIIAKDPASLVQSVS